MLNRRLKITKISHVLVEYDKMLQILPMRMSLQLQIRKMREIRVTDSHVSHLTVDNIGCHWNIYCCCCARRREDGLQTPVAASADATSCYDDDHTASHGEVKRRCLRHHWSHFCCPVRTQELTCASVSVWYCRWHAQQLRHRRLYHHHSCYNMYTDLT